MPVDVFPGETWDLWGTYTADADTLTRNPTVLVGATIQVGLGGSRRQPDAWETPTDTDTATAASAGTLRASIGDWLERSAGNYWMWIKVTTSDGVVDIAPATNIRIHILETDAV